MASKPFYQSGRYACKITGQALGKAGTGNPQFVLRFQVFGLVDPQDPSRFIPAPQQYERTHYRTITEKTVPYLLEDLKILGFDGDSFRDLDPGTEGFCDFRGKDVDMWCAHEQAQDGGEREKWSVARQGGGEMKVDPLDSKKVRELDNLFGKQLKGLRSATSPRPRTETTVAAGDPLASEGITDDDVPF